VPVGWSGVCYMRRLRRIVMLVLMLMIVPEIWPAVFARFAPVRSPIAVLRRPVCLMSL
jgi:hypothetical protein